MSTTLGEIAKIAGVNNIFSSAKADIAVKNLLTDSRSFLNNEGTLFFAIPTRTNDGTKYMRELYDKGVRMFVAPSIPENMKNLRDAVIIPYDNPVELLQKITSRSDRNGLEIIAITGSKGKTTLKEMLFQLLEPLKEISRSPRSYNSQIGVPLSMWEISPQTELAIIEAGISRTGEMKELEECIRPDTVIITDINSEHDEGFSNLSEKIREKSLLAENADKIIYCADNVLLKDILLSQFSNKRLVSWSMKSENSDLKILNIQHSDQSISSDKHHESDCLLTYGWQNKTGKIKFKIKEESDIRNACYALCYMLAEGYSPEIISERFQLIHPIETRMSVSDGAGGCSILYDSYTSDLTSLIPAVDFMMRRKMPGQKSVVILSDIYHKGDEDYKKIAELMNMREIDLFIGVGPEITRNASKFKSNSLFFPDTYSLRKWLKENPLMNSIILLKGSPEFDFQMLKEVLEIRTHQTLLEVNLDAILKNYRYFKSHLPASCGMVAMVKASAYGAGSYEIAKTLQDAGAAYLAVAVLDEGIDLRRQGITMPIMVMNPRVADYAEMFKYNLEPEIYTLDMLNDVIRAAKRADIKNYPIHLKLDTGMHRMGFIEEELPTLMQILSNEDNVRISSVFSHLATADEPTMNDYTEMQLEVFEKNSAYMLEHCAYPFKRHILNSAGILRYGDTHHYDMARLGIGLYGVNTLPPEMEDELEVVSSLKTVIINLREWGAGTSIGYGRKGRLTRDSKIATIPIGYADGMSRKFGNGAIKVSVNGCEAPTIGNICMDACMIDVTNIDCKIGDEVEIFGNIMPINRLAEVAQTIPYEILTSVSPRVKRIYFRE